MNARDARLRDASIATAGFMRAVALPRGALGEIERLLTGYASFLRAKAEDHVALAACEGRDAQAIADLETALRSGDRVFSARTFVANPALACWLAQALQGHHSGATGAPFASANGDTIVVDAAGVRSVRARAVWRLADVSDALCAPLCAELATERYGRRHAPESARSALASAFAVLQRAWPGAAHEVAYLVRAVLAAEAPPGRQMSGSSALCPLVIGLSFGVDDSPVSLADALVHEASHIKLRLAMHRVPFVDEDNRESYRHPWRSDPRPLVAVLVACHAFTAVHRFYVRHLRTMPADVSAREGLDRLDQELASALATLERADGFTAHGLALRDTLRAAFERSRRLLRRRGRAVRRGDPIALQATTASAVALPCLFGDGLRVPRRATPPEDVALAGLEIARAARSPLHRCGGQRDWSGVARLTPRTRPFGHGIGREVFAPEVADAWLDCLERYPQWRAVHGGFYASDQAVLATLDQAALAALDYSPALRRLLAPEGLAVLRVAASAFFACPLQLHGPVVAHRMRVGQGVGIHSDAPAAGEETHRVVIFLARDPAPRNGGHFLLLDGPAAHHARCILPLTHNAAIAFALTPDSYHAISCIGRGTRYSLVLSFRAGAPR